LNSFFVGIAFFGLTIPALANTLNVSTGVAGGATYTVVEQNFYNLGATATAALVTPADPDWSTVWLPNTSDSAWIAYNPMSCCDSGLGNYSTTFELTPGDVSTVALSGAWTLDDSGSLYLNGKMLGYLGDGSWGSLTSFNVPVGSPDFVVGTNTLSIDITDSDSFLEAVRLQGSLTGYTPVPEPSSLAALIVGMGILMGFVTRTKA
jgi:hypothetical protein